MRSIARKVSTVDVTGWFTAAADRLVCNLGESMADRRGDDAREHKWLIAEGGEGRWL